MSLHTILGAGGSVGNELVPVLLANKEMIRLVSRKPIVCEGTEHVSADLTNFEQTLNAVKGSSVVYLLVGLQYDSRVWETTWPTIMTNTINACKQTNAKLIFIDNVYMYGKVDGAMTEETPFNPCSKKGKIRAAIAKQLLNEMNAGNIKALIARGADFYGPCGEKSSMPNILVFTNLAKKKKAQWLSNTNLPHSFTFIPDIAKALYLLANDETAFGQTWHLPTKAKALTGKEFIEISAKAFNRPKSVFVFPNWMVAMVGLFNRDIFEIKEMLYQNEYSYIFDSSKFENHFHFSPTSYEDGIKATAEYYLNK